jgi:Collagen triple helix repeat (20 copies)
MKRTILIIGAAAPAAVGVAAGVAWSAIPGSDGVIHSCYSQANGTFRPIDTQASPPQKCKSGETQLDWNQKGPKGDPGAAGTPGAPGTPGLKGDKGDQGTQGLPGTNGLDGKDGQPGRDGTNGTNGEHGVDGTNGADGKDGVSVTSVALASGDANCPDGGSQFTAANGTTFACNGRPGTAGGPTGQDASSSSGTGSVRIDPNVSSNLTLVPGLSTTVDVPASSFLFVTTDGGTVCAPARVGETLISIQLAVDGVLIGQQIVDINCPGVAGYGHWSLARTVRLAPGSHTISVLASGIGGNFGQDVSGDGSSVNQGSLGVLTLKQ